ncbi:tRNA threonylcarbamoyladenosine biosynthesis protein TsaB [Rothia sp. HMSC066H02]|uniref:tRNA (adenosine(37)-N6)-threonylcarbamoyltransferase complex dimerization subunit type 1 TsaB n=1 Tax=Rothia TaxID=32207 RepID=UPI0008A54520|nr:MULTISPECIES: tRNA (adenosine(37)-N6)-threonylcarbamoyltransferase complex dimerization subunit type 1 TsaB [Rothia]OFO97918.1 tRNA threonylcarbamoyladenosine biosynthesis protein TsaB [Rothia sp. HMSC065D09]OFP12756.1 tRNA threonylcarbamoyladenosine biosynthesis protein TsaB [Rothia sp. HMSC066H02]
MLVLALDSSATASVALARVHGSEAGASFEILARYESEDTRSHAEVMGPYAQAALQDAGVRGEDLDAILTGTGPGPFTGLRAGIVTARALGFAWSVPVYGMMSLTALAERAVSGVVAGEAGVDTAGEENAERAFASAESAELIEGAELLVLSDARRREVYSARYRVNAEGYSLVDGPNVCPASEILPGGAPSYAYGYGAGLYSEALEEHGWTIVESARGVHPHAEYLVAAAARLGVENLSEDTSAQYLRDSDAKVPAAMLARQQKQAAQAAGQATAQTAAQKEG